MGMLLHRYDAEKKPVEEKPAEKQAEKEQPVKKSGRPKKK